MIRLLRGWWRQLTSMRTALVLLFLLAVAAVPGSVFPQTRVSAEKVATYRAQNPDLAPWLDRLAMFDVYASPWFAAIYLLLMISLVGCLIPRLREHLTAVRRKPPTAPRNLTRLPVHRDVGTIHGTPAAVAEHLAAALRRQRFRVTVRAENDGVLSVAAEKGHLREAGNLVFHLSLLVLLAGIAVGNGWGWYGNRLLVSGADNGFCTSIQQFDEYGLGPRIDAGDVPGYCLQLDRFAATFLDNGQPVEFRADIGWGAAAGLTEAHRLEVNDPLRLPDATVYLLGHGYALDLRYTDTAGQAVTVTVPFLPADTLHTSDGVVLLPDANADRDTGQRSRTAQMAFSGTYQPTAGTDGRSRHPDERDPLLTLNAYRGDLGLDGGVPQSVYTLPRRALADGRLQPIGGTPGTLRPGGSWTLDDGSRLEFLTTRRWITITIRNDPGEPIVLAAAVALLGGLIPALTVRRRRIWFRAETVPDGSAVTAAALARADDRGLGRELDTIIDRAGLTATDGEPVRFATTAGETDG